MPPPLCSWVSSQADERAGELWISGVEDYLKHARGLLSEFGDVIAAAGAGACPPRALGLGFRGDNAPCATLDFKFETELVHDLNILAAQSLGVTRVGFELRSC